jgi:hypothetical protein
MYADTLQMTIPQRTDYLYPTIAFEHLNAATGIFFILGLIASTYASSDSALTALTTSFCVDFLNFEKKAITNDASGESRQGRVRTWVHLGFSVLFVVIILILDAFSSDAVINLIFRIAGYTYGPLLGLFSFGLFTSRQLHPYTIPLPGGRRLSPVLLICLAAPAITWIIEVTCKSWFDIGFLTILLNGILTFVGLLLISHRKAEEIG